MKFEHLLSPMKVGNKVYRNRIVSAPMAFGLIVQNPYGMGYETVVAAARDVLGLGNEAVIDSGYTWVTKENMNKNAIKRMLY